VSALVIGLGVLVAPIVAWLVYRDAARHGRSRATDPWAALAVGTVSLGGFLAPALAEGALARVYLVRVKSAPVVTSPAELLMLRIAVGLGVTAAALVVYGGVRWGTRRDRG
jgi:hypothetical protein